MEGLVRESKLLEKYEFRNGRLVIDGVNLMYFLYFDSKLDQMHGGDYVGFKDVVYQFFQSLTECKIQPYVLLDGGSDSSDRKLDTLRSRFENKIEKARKLAHSSPLEPNHYEGVLPPLIKDVFKQVLTTLEVPFAQCFGEADSEIVSLANYWHCPVLSNDSDFYTFDLEAGFLPLKKFQWKRREEQHIDTMLYTMAKFCDHFKVDRVLVPVFASIAGNDYGRLEDNNSFSKDYASESIKSNMNWKLKRLYAILSFLKTQNQQGQVKQVQEQAVDKALTVAREQKDHIRKSLLKSVQSYSQPPDCPLALFFENATTPSKPENFDVLPDWTLRPLIEGRLTSFIIDVLRLKRMMLSPQVEDSYQRSGHYTARPIRQHLYGLLLGTNGGRVEEYDRKQRTLEVIPVLPTQPHLQQVQLITLDTLDKVLKLINIYRYYKMHINALYALCAGA